MSGELAGRWDEAVEGAWRGFRQRLADRLAEMEDDDTLVVELPEEVEAGAAPYCQVAAGDGWLRVEAVSNVYLDGRFRLDGAQEQRLLDLGFTAPVVDDPAGGETNFWADVEQREADRAAVVIVRALREVYAVVHPVYLAADGLEPSGGTAADPGDGPPDPPWCPTTPEEVRAGVDAAVRDLFLLPPEWDEDGDLPLPTGHGWVWVVVSATGPRILLHAPLVDEVADEPRALVELNLLNQKAIGLSFSLREGRISVMRELDVTVLLPAQVRAEIERLTDHVDDWATDLVARVGGRLMDDSTARPAPGLPPRPPAGRPQAVGSERFATAYAVLQELEKQQRGSVDPVTMSRIFHQDTALLLQAIQATDERLSRWRQRERDAVESEGREATLRLARTRQRHLRDLRTRMRAALRLLVTAPARRVQSDQPALFDDEDYRSGR